MPRTPPREPANEAATRPRARRRIAGAGTGTPAAKVSPERESGTVFRVLNLIEALIEYPGETNSELADRLDLPRPTVHRLLGMLSERGFAAQSEPARYVAGGALQRLAGRLNSHLPWANLAGPLLRHLSDSFSETAFLNLLVRERLSRFVVLSTQPPIPLRYAIDINEWVSLLWGAGGRAILAYLTAGEIATAIARNDPSPFGGQSVDPRELHRSLAATRNVGYALVRSHRQRDAVGIAVPFFDATGEVMGSIGITLPAERYQERNVVRYATALIKAASSLSTKLGRDPA